MPSTYEPIATNTLSSAATSVTFSSIPSTYTDLVLVTSSKSAPSPASDDIRIYITLNNDASSGLYSGTVLYGNGTSALSYRETGRNQVDNSIQSATNATAGYAIFTYNIMNYANTTTFKTVLQRSGSNSNNTPSYNAAGTAVSLWRNTNAITRVDAVAQGGASVVGFAIGSTFTLYGIRAA
jgi:hypothetical protein